MSIDYRLSCFFVFFLFEEEKVFKSIDKSWGCPSWNPTILIANRKQKGSNVLTPPQCHHNTLANAIGVSFYSREYGNIHNFPLNASFFILQCLSQCNSPNLHDLYIRLSSILGMCLRNFGRHWILNQQE